MLADNLTPILIVTTLGGALFALCLLILWHHHEDFEDEDWQKRILPWVFYACMVLCLGAGQLAVFAVNPQPALHLVAALFLLISGATVCRWLH